jgi:hypothetical protein
LPWQTPIVQTTEEYTSAHIGIVNNDIILKTPYNKSFITVFRTESQSCFVWDHMNKYYIGPLSTYSLKLAINTTTKYFNEVKYSNNVKQLLSDLEEYNNAKYWNPTLVCCNGNYLIACSNEALDEAIKHIELNNNSKTLAELVRYGITINSDIQCTEEEYFAAKFNNKIELNDICTIVPYLKNIGCDFVSLQGIIKNNLLPDVAHPIRLSQITKMQETLRQELNLANIKYNVNNDSYTVVSELSKYNFPVLINFRNNNKAHNPKHLAKVITVVNSNPVQLQLRNTNDETM